MSKQNRPLYLISSDSVGLLGTSNQILYLWQEYFENKTIDGVEVISFGPISRLNNLVSGLKNNHVPVLSFHGQTGDVKKLPFLKRLIMIFVNATFISTTNLLKNFGRNIDILFHTTLTELKNTQKIIIENPPCKLWVENNPSGEEEIKKTIQQVQNYRQNNINTFGLFDVFHYVRNQSSGELLKNWSQIVGKIEYYIDLKDKDGRQFFTGLHFPIGTRLADSLPIEVMTDDMLSLFAEKIISKVERVVFENQQDDFGLLYSTPGMLEKQKIRNGKIIERFKRTGIII